MDGSGELGGYSSRGPRVGDGAIEPDLTAPGSDVAAARAEHAVHGEPVGDSYLRMTGTSMAAPHVAGAAAVLAGQHPDWTAPQLRAALMGSAAPHGKLSVYEQGAGRVDVSRATTQQVRADVGSLSLGTALWPHGDDEPVTREVTYHNDGDHAVTLTLSTDVRAPGGGRAPVGMFRILTRRLEVPAHGHASTHLTADTRAHGPDGLYEGALVASAGRTRVRVPLAIEREVESYEVDVSYLDHDGKRPTGDLVVQRIVDVERERYRWPDVSSDGPTKVRLPKGTYYAETAIQTVLSKDPWEELFTVCVEPSFTVKRNTKTTCDARDGVPLGLRTDRAEARVASSLVSSFGYTEWGGEDPAGTQWGSGSLDGFTKSPYEDYVSWSSKDRVGKDLDRHIHDRDLAEVPTRIAAQTRPRPGGSTRVGSYAQFEIPMYSEQARGRYGFSATESASTRLLRDGRQIASSTHPGSWQRTCCRHVGRRTGSRRRRRGATRRSTRGRRRRGRSGPGGTDEVSPVPLLAVRFAPRLDELNRAPAGRELTVPVRVERVEGASYGTLTSLQVEVSYDGGGTWRRAPVVGDEVRLTHPEDAEFVSLRATAADTGGSRVEQTVLNAYAVRPTG